MNLYPAIEGAIELDSNSKISFLLANSLILFISCASIYLPSISDAKTLISVAIRIDLNIPEFVVFIVDKHLYTPFTSTLSPGFTLLTKSSSNTTSTEIGRSPFIFTFF